jgi:hypothetical protein
VALGQERHDDVLEHVVADLHRPLDVLRDPARHRTGLLDVRGRDGARRFRFDWLH